MDLDRRCVNHSAMSFRCLPMTDARGAEVGVVIAKMTYTVNAAGKCLVDEAPVRLGPVYADRSVRLPSDAAAQKPGTDVLLVGTAHPPPHRQVSDMYVRLRVGSAINKVVRVHGPRVYQRQGLRNVIPSAAAPLTPTRLSFENAYGGHDPVEPSLADRRNPVGRGFAIDKLRLLGTPVPQLEDPFAPLDSENPAPATFAPLPPDWEPRVRFAGTYDARWMRERAPLPPRDHDERHACCAPHDLWSQTPLACDEPIEVVGATPEGTWRFQLPRYTALFGVTVRGDRKAIETHLDTLLIDADARRVELVFRAAFALPKKAEMIDAVEIVGSEPLPYEALGGPPGGELRAAGADDMEDRA
jgi:hypothetical protein